MKKAVIFLMLICMASVAFGRAYGLEELVDSALARNPSVGAAAMEVEKARLLKGTAFDAPMTEITLKQESTGGGGPENGVMISQEFAFPTLYAARHRSLSARQRLAAARFDAAAADVEAEVAGAYYEALYFGQMLALNGRLAREYEEFVRVAEIRLETGEGSALEALNARRVMEKNLVEAQNLRLGLEAAQGRLAAVCGMSGRVEISVPDGSLALASRRGSGSFEFGATVSGLEAGSAVEAAEREVGLARNEFAPVLRLGATVQALIKGFNPYHVERLPFPKGNFMGFEVGVSVPLFFGAQTARLKAAAAERQISVLNMEAAEQQSRSEVETLERTLAQIASRLDYLSSAGVARADEIRRLAKVSYELGEIDYLEYIANLETAYEVYGERLEAARDYNLTVTKLNRIWK